MNKQLIEQLKQAETEAGKAAFALSRAYREAANEIHAVLTSSSARGLEAGVVGDAKALYANLLDCVLTIEIAAAQRKQP